MSRRTVLGAIDSDGKDVCAAMLGREDVDHEIHEIAVGIFRDGERDHDALCPHDETCRGGNAHVLDVMKERLMTGDFTDSEVLAIVADIFFILGRQAAKIEQMANEDPLTRILRDIMNGDDGE